MSWESISGPVILDIKAQTDLITDIKAQTDTIDDAITDIATIDTKMTGVYDSSLAVSDRDGNVFEVLHYMINQLANTQPVTVIQSDPIQGIRGVSTLFFSTLLDIDGNPWVVGDIDITAATCVLEKSCNGVPFSIVGVTQPTLTKGAGYVSATTPFDPLEWDVDCIYRLTIAGVVLHDGVDFNVQTMMWNNTIADPAAIDQQVDFIVTALTAPINNSTETTTIADTLGRKGDTSMSNITSSAMNLTRNIQSGQNCRRFKVVAVTDPTHFTTDSAFTAINDTFKDWYVMVYQSVSAVHGEFTQIISYTQAGGIVEHTALTVDLTAGDSVYFIHPMIYNSYLIKAETDKIPTLVTNLALPVADAADKATIADTVGNKDDTIAGTSSISLLKQSLAATTAIDLITSVIPDGGAMTSIAQELTLGVPADGDIATDILNVQTVVDLITGYALDATLAVPTADVVTNATEAQVIGNKADAAVTVVGVTKSIIAYVKGILTNLNLVKVETDKIPSIKTTVEAITDYALDSTVAKAATVALDATVAKDATVSKDATVAKASVLGAAVAATISADIQVIDTVVDSIKVDTTPKQQSVYPTLAGGVVVTGAAGAWTLGNFIQVIPVNTIAIPITIKDLHIGAASSDATYELVLYKGLLGAEIEIGRTRFTRVDNLNLIGDIRCNCITIAANTRVTAKICSSNGGSRTATISLMYDI